MASSGKKRDPLAHFWNDLTDEQISSDSDETDEDENKAVSDAPSFISKPTKCNEETDDSKPSLPSAKTVLENKTKPEFLEKRNVKDIDWDKIVKNDTVIDTDDDSVLNTNKMPPPKSYDPVTEKIKPTLGETEQNSLKRTQGIYIFIIIKAHTYIYTHIYYTR